MFRYLTRIASFSIMCAVLVSCTSGSSSPDTGGSDDSANGGAGAGNELTYDGPPATFAVEPGASSTRFQWSVTVPTGGWGLRFAGSSYDPKTTHAVIKAELTRPAADEIVTQALETLTGEYTHGAIAFESAELRITITTRGEDTPEEYRVAATWP